MDIDEIFRICAPLAEVCALRVLLLLILVTYADNMAFTIVKPRSQRYAWWDTFGGIGI